MNQATEIVLRGVGEPESLEIRTRALPDPQPGQALVRVEATGVSFAEQQMRRGKYYDQPPFPFVPGYDLVGVVEATGNAGAPAVGQRVAALTKIGGWADRVLLDADDLVPVPRDLDPVAAETVVVNGITAWRMLHRSARVRAGQTIVVLRAIPIDYRSENVAARVRELAPDGVAAVFDHVGGPGIVDSWRMLARGGTLVSYGTASTRDQPGNPRRPVLALVARLTAWNLLPNGRKATFFNLWAGRRLRPARYRAQLRHDLDQVLDLVAQGAITPQVARRFALTDAAAALRYAESGGITGKVILTPQDA